MNRLNRILPFVFALVLLVPALPAAAQGRGGGHGGGGRGGGGHGGGAHGSGARGGGSHGGGSHGGGSHGGGSHGHGGSGHGHYHYGGGWGWGYWGWPGYYGYYGWPGYYGYYGPGYGYYGSGYGSYDEGSYGASSEYAVIDTDISPEEAEVYVDGRYMGTADDFDGFPDYLYLPPGRYHIKLRLSYETVTKQIEARPGMKLDFNDHLHKIPGANHHGSYEHPQLQGGEVQRYYGRSRNSVEAVDPYQHSPGSSVMVEPDDARDAPPPQDRAPALQQHPRVHDQSGENWRGGPRGEPRTRLRLKVEPPPCTWTTASWHRGRGQLARRGVSVSAASTRYRVASGFRSMTTDITVEQGRTERWKSACSLRNSSGLILGLVRILFYIRPSAPIRNASVCCRAGCRAGHRLP
jgi:hypothetical protein